MKKMPVFLSSMLCVVMLSCSAFAAEPIKIGVYEPMTGPMAAGGQQTMEGINLAHDTRSEVLGRPIELILVDNKSEKVEAANAIARLIDKEKVVAVIGSYGSSLSLAGGPLAMKAKIPVMGCSPTNPLVTKDNPYYFRACFIDPFQGAVMAKYAFRELGAKKAAIVQDVAQDYSVGLANFFRKAFIEFTGDPESIVALTSFQTGDSDFTAQLTHIISKNPDVIFMPSYYQDMAQFAIQAQQLDVNVPILGGDTLEAPELISVGGDAVEGITFSTHYSAEAAVRDASKQFVEVYQKKYNGNMPNTFAALGYDAYMLIVDAIEASGSADPETIRDTIAGFSSHEAVTGMVTFDSNGDPVKSAVILKVDGGEFKYITTVDP
ncbi:branched-chain amino acid ABC transporter substrate-binding protein [candidate division KSB3 bacterium]|uniref:Branched-chain amino acid ABC transporter substrate-binding protein n=1 Tax=candidate division KSB3 bacterium TaxID=2044937 RepID=A0A2G6E168_9BACT|nr:MAG: branched-chain amino acid ABC transporter substrate-binding protein [candidate division KSB3 bacterium]